METKIKLFVFTLSLVGLCACDRSCCMEKCDNMQWQCVHSVSDTVQPRCFESVDKCSAACENILGPRVFEQTR